jgi:thiol-disulfide isomerase/thioredoxin
MNRVITAFVVGLLLVSNISAQDKPTRGIAGDAAPSWEITEWGNLPAGTKSLDVADYKGKTVYLYCFQSWCPGCLKHGFPTLQAIQKHYKNDPNVVFVAVQTTFEGGNVNTFANAKKTVAKFGLDIPVGQSGDGEQRSKFLKSYRTGGTPWTIIIGPNGVVAGDDFLFDRKDAIKIIDGLNKS